MAALAALMAIVCVVAAVLEIRRTGEIVSPLILFLALSAFDVYLPAIVFAISGPPDLAPWLDGDAVVRAMPSGVVVFTVGLVLFVLAYALAHRWPENTTEVVATEGRLTPRGALFASAALVVAALWFGWALAYRSAAVGSFQAYVANGLVVRWQAEPLATQYPAAGSLTVLALQIGDAMLPVITLSALILMTARFIHPVLRFVVAPAIGLVANLTTFFRGSLLSYFVSLAAFADRRSATRRPAHIVGVSLVAVGVVLFLGYGVIRNVAVLAAQYQAQATALGTPVPATATPGGTGAPAIGLPNVPVLPSGAPALTGEAVNYEAGRVLKGEGLVGLSSIIAYYPSRLEFLGGQTIRDMLLLPVPRSIWHEKPAWYGIAQITRGEGEPASTQSAVTIPGELYANFGPLGLAGMLVYGMLFGFFHRRRNGRRFRYAYAAILLPLMFVTFWMSTTGFINGLLPLAPAAVVLLTVFPANLSPRRLRAARLRSLSA